MKAFEAQVAEKRCILAETQIMAFEKAREEKKRQPTVRSKYTTQATNGHRTPICVNYIKDVGWSIITRTTDTGEVLLRQNNISPKPIPLAK